MLYRATSRALRTKCAGSALLLFQHKLSFTRGCSSHGQSSFSALPNHSTQLKKHRSMQTWLRRALLTFPRYHNHSTFQNTYVQVSSVRKNNIYANRDELRKNTDDEELYDKVIGGDFPTETKDIKVNVEASSEYARVDFDRKPMSKSTFNDLNPSEKPDVDAKFFELLSKRQNKG